MTDPQTPPPRPVAGSPDATARTASQYPGLTEAEGAAVGAFIHEMTNSVIPAIVEAVEERRNSARLSRDWPLKTGG